MAEQQSEVSMDYMYHIVPNPMIGTILYPLNKLKEVDLAAYKRAASKYLADPDRHRRDRRALMRRRVPILDCQWSDVLHSSTVPPRDLMDMWHESGYFPKQALVMFEIPIEVLDREKVVIYKNQRDYLKWMRWNYQRYDPEIYEKYSQIPEKARIVMRQLITKQQIWHFLHIPHVLYRGEIETKDLRVIIVNP